MALSEEEMVVVGEGRGFGIKGTIKLNFFRNIIYSIVHTYKVIFKLNFSPLTLFFFSFSNIIFLKVGVWGWGELMLVVLVVGRDVKLEYTRFIIF